MWALRFLAFLTLLAAASGAVAGAEDQRAFLTLTVNTQSEGDVLALVRENDVLLKVSDLDAAAMRGFSGTRETIDGTLWVSLRSLAPGITYVYDEDGLTIAVTANAQYFGVRNYDLGTQHPAGLVYGTDSSAYLNYSLSEANGNPSLFLESSITNGIARLYLSGYANPEVHLGRGLDSLIWDNRLKLRTTAIGDDAVSAGDLGSNVIVTGFDIRRNAGLDPYVVTYPTVGMTGSVTTPSTADLYVNGILVKRIDLPPGSYNLNNLPVPNGIANAQLVIRDALGRQTTVTRGFYQTANLLAKGDIDYDYALGFPRVSTFSTLDSSRSGAVIGRYQVGLTDAFTAGGRFESSGSLASGGPIFDVRLPFGALHIAGAASTQNGATGTATSLGYTYSGRVFGFGVFQTALSSGYARIDLPVSSDRALVDFLANANVNVSHAVSLSGNYERQNYRDSGVGSTFFLGATYSINRQLNLNVNVSRAFGTTIVGRVDSIFATLTYTSDRHTSVSASYQNVGGEQSPVVAVQRAAPVGSGVGYNAIVTGGTVRSFTGEVVANAPFGQYTLDYGTASGSTFATGLTLAGSFVTMGHGVDFSRPILDGFALVDATGPDRLNVQLENQDVATVRSGGRVVLPNLTPNFANRVSAADPNAPINSTIDRDEFIVAPAVQSGVRVRFKANTFQAFEGSIVVVQGEKTFAAAYGQMTLTNAGKNYRSDLGENGEFYFENLPAGKYDGTAEYREGTCTLHADVPESKAIAVDLGSITCATR